MTSKVDSAPTTLENLEGATAVPVSEVSSPQSDAMVMWTVAFVAEMPGGCVGWRRRHTSLPSDQSKSQTCCTVGRKLPPYRHSDQQLLEQSDQQDLRPHSVQFCISQPSRHVSLCTVSFFWKKRVRCVRCRTHPVSFRRIKDLWRYWRPHRCQQTLIGSKERPMP